MDSRIAAELLYESEATLRMVDTVLEELHLEESDHGRGTSPGANQFKLSPTLSVNSSVASAHTYWQVQELLDCVQEARVALGDMANQRELELEGQDAGSQIASLLAIVEDLSGSDADQPVVGAPQLAVMREALVKVLNTLPAPSESRSAAAHLLDDAESKLARLSRALERGHQPF